MNGNNKALAISVIWLTVAIVALATGNVWAIAITIVPALFATAVVAIS
jgi:hypothetical protein